MRKVFSDFFLMNFMNNKIAIPVIIIAVAITGIAITVNINQSETMEVEDTVNEEFRPTEEITTEVQEKLDEIEKKNLENTYTPKEREWITSGPFQIDRTEYILGEKIFLRIGGLEYEEKGQVVFLMPSNGTHYTVYISIPFDGAKKSAFNYYVEPDLSSRNNICKADELIGDWKIVFRGTNYPNIEFRVTDEILPGDEPDYEPVC